MLRWSSSEPPVPWLFRGTGLGLEATRSAASESRSTPRAESSPSGTTVLASACGGLFGGGIDAGDDLLRAAERREGLRGGRFHARRPCRLSDRSADARQPLRPTLSSHESVTAAGVSSSALCCLSLPGIVDLWSANLSARPRQDPTPPTWGRAPMAMPDADADARCHAARYLRTPEYGPPLPPRTRHGLAHRLRQYPAALPRDAPSTRTARRPAAQTTVRRPARQWENPGRAPPRAAGFDLRRRARASRASAA